MTKTELKENVRATGNKFFDRSAMRFFGDTMANYYVPKSPVLVEKDDGETIQCWELQRRRAVNGGLCCSSFFNTQTFARVLPN